MPLWVPLMLCLPALIPLAWTFYTAHNAGLEATTFVQYDEPYYLANARQHFVDGFHLTYGNPYARYDSPRIYFQPQFFVLGLIQWAGVGPELTWLFFGLCAMAFAALAAGKLYEEWVGWRTTAHKLGFVCFFWGGGVLGLGGLLFGLFARSNLTQALFSFDPGGGWWMLNFGRNLIYPHEAYYHGLYLLTILLLLRRRFVWVAAAAALMSMSHPFTGLSLALTLCAYSAVEWRLKSGAASPGLFAASAAILVAHLGYYMVFLNRFADHKELRLQWELDWPYMFWTILPALYLVGILAFGRLTRWKNLAPVLADPRMRLCLIWFAVILGLTQHDVLIKPMQPIHFAHGYDWIALFLLATPALIAMIERLTAARKWAMLAGLLLVFFSDNLLWFTTFHDPKVQRYAIHLTKDQQGVLRWLGEQGGSSAYVASQDHWISYLTPTFTKLRAWRGHNYNTPNVRGRDLELEAAFAKGVELPADRPVYYVPSRGQEWTPPPGARQVYANDGWVIWRSDGRALVKR